MRKGALRWSSMLALVVFLIIPIWAMADTLDLSYEFTDPTAVVTVTLDNAQSVGSVQIVLEYNPDQLTIDPASDVVGVGRAAEATGFSVLANIPKPGEGELRIAVIHFLGGTLAPGAGPIVQITAQVSEWPAPVQFKVDGIAATAVFGETGEAVPEEELVTEGTVVQGEMPPEIVSASPDRDSITQKVCKGDEPWVVDFSVEAVDPNPGDVLTYAWYRTITSGKAPGTEEALEGFTDNSLTYVFEGVLPDETVTYTVSVVVSDPSGESVRRDWTVQIGCKVVPIELSRFVAQPSVEGVVLSWATASETNNVGWNVYRSLAENGTYVKVNERLIPGAGTSSEMKIYEYVDRTAMASSTYWYYLEQVNLDGTRTQSFRISTATTDVAEETRRELPTAFALRNFPNPFNPATEIEYALPEEHHVRLTVYNILGQQVAVLVDAVRPAGVYRVTWRPERLQSGVYVYRLDAGSFVQAKKMTYLR